jgi:hypothetical protein
VKTKPVTPYARLKTEFANFVDLVLYPHTKLLWTYPKARLDEGWTLSNLAERVSAAAQLGYDVVLTRSENGDLVVQYRKQRPTRPWNV